MAADLNDNTALRVAMFTRGIDGLFLPPQDGVVTLALVERSSTEEKWAREFLSPAAVLPYSILRPGLGPYPSTAELLEHSDIHAVMQQARVSSLLLSSACSPAIHAWAKHHGMRLLMSDYAQQQQLEDKLWFDGFLRRHGIARPAGGVFRPGRTQLPVRGRAVVQVPKSMGGEGTYFVDGPAALQRMLEAGVLTSGECYLARKFIPGHAYGITVLVTPGRIDLSALRLQCYYAAAATGAQTFAGIQFCPTPQLAPRLQTRVNQTFMRLGELLYQRRFFGFANFDFMIDDRQRVFVLECNPRMSAATPQLLGRPELLCGGAAGTLFLQGFVKPRRYSRAVASTSMPPSEYAGATLEIVHQAAGPATAARSFQSGRYRLRDKQVTYLGPDVRGPGAADELCLFSFARPGQECQPGDTLACLMSNFALYDAQGGFLDSARALLAYFRYVDAS